MGNSDSNSYNSNESVSLNSSYTVSIRPQRVDTLIELNSSVSPKRNSTPTSFMPEYHVEHLVDVRNDSLTSVCLCYNVDNSLKVGSCHTKERLLGDNDLFHIHSLYIPVTLQTCPFVLKFIESKTQSTKQKYLLTEAVEGLANELYSDDLVAMEMEELVLKEYYSPSANDRRIEYKNLLQFDWVSVDSLRGKFLVSVSMLQQEFAGRILQTTKQKDYNISSGFLIMEKDRQIPIFITARNNRLFFQKMSAALRDLGTQTKNTITSSTLR